MYLLLLLINLMHLVFLTDTKTLNSSVCKKNIYLKGLGDEKCNYLNIKPVYWHRPDLRPISLLTAF